MLPGQMWTKSRKYFKEMAIDKTNAVWFNGKHEKHN